MTEVIPIANYLEHDFDSNMRILLVEDDEIDFMIINRLLKKAYGSSLDLHRTDSAENAMQQLIELSFDVFLIDFQLGSTNGLELLVLMNEAGYQEIPKILLTGMESLKIDRQATEAGATDYLVKNTLTPEQLERSIRYSLKQKKIEQQVSYLALHDSLTGLANRALLVEHLERAISSSKRHQEYAALLFIDLDHFKTINDSLGHDIGDQVLVETGKRLLQKVRREDVVCRFGGDEFVLLLTRLGQQEAHALNHVRRIALKINQAINEPMKIDGKELRCSTSIGATLFCDAETSIATILKQADIAMYRAKSEGRNSTSMFESSMEDIIQASYSIGQDLELAIPNQQFNLHYQPIVTLDNHQTIGAEALIRWHHPDKGHISPADFIPIAEENDMICSIGRWVLKQGCDFLQRQPDLAYLSLNIGKRHFEHQAFVSDLEMALNESGVAPQRIIIELTENLFLKNPLSSCEKMGKLRSMGIRFALDDFGTGYSSLALLKDLPVDILKIDQSFTRCIGEDSSGEAIIKAIISMAQALNLKVIAEGVEKTTHAKFMFTHDCLFAQGYHFSRPIPEGEFSTLLLDRKTINPKQTL